MNVAATYRHLYLSLWRPYNSRKKATILYILSLPRPFVRLGKVCKVWIWLHYCFLWLFRQWKVSKELVFFLLSLSHFHCLTNLYHFLPQALTKDKLLTILIHQCILYNMFWLAPDHMVFYLLLNEKSYFTKEEVVRTTFTFSHEVHCYHSQKNGERVKGGGCLTKLVGSSYLYTLI